MAHVTIPVSTVPSVKRYIAEEVTNAMVGRVAQGHGVLVSYDPPGRYRPDDIIAIGNLWDRQVSGFNMVGTGGKAWLKEEYELEITSTVRRAGESLQVEAYERAHELNSIVESVVREDPSLGGRVIVARPRNTRDEADWGKDSKGFIVHVITRIYVMAQI